MLCIDNVNNWWFCSMMCLLMLWVCSISINCWYIVEIKTRLVLVVTRNGERTSIRAETAVGAAEKIDFTTNRFSWCIEYHQKVKGHEFHFPTRDICPTEWKFWGLAIFGFSNGQKTEAKNYGINGLLGRLGKASVLPTHQPPNTHPRSRNVK